MPEFNPDMVLFDLDGTLVDSVPDLSIAINSMLERLGLPVHSEESIRLWIGNGLERLVKRALTNNMNGEPEDTLFAKAYPLFMQNYTENSCHETRLYEGVETALNYLNGNDFKLGCVTNKMEVFTHRILRKLDIYDAFGIIISGDTLPRKKPDPLPLKHAAKYFNASPEDSLMVGDSKNDIVAASAAGFRICCVSYGYNHGNDIRAAGPDAVLDTLADLPDLLGNFPC
jgi:phosphoglycolate phosphatase